MKAVQSGFIQSYLNCLMSLVLFVSFFSFKKHFFKVYCIFERERERERLRQRDSMSRGEAERESKRERETQNPKQASGSRLSLQSLTQGWNSPTVRS